MAAKRSKDADRKRVAEKRAAEKRPAVERVRRDPCPCRVTFNLSAGLGATAPDTLAIKAPPSTTKNAILRRIAPTNSTMYSREFERSGTQNLYCSAPRCHASRVSRRLAT